MASEKRLQFVLDLVDNFTKKADKVLKTVEGINSKFDEALDSSKKASLGLAALSTALVAAGTMAVKKAAEFETFEVQLRTLLGSAEEASERMKELAEFGKTTPFELDEVVQASIVLETLTKGALATGDGLRKVGDIAALTSLSFEEAGVWVGRLYDAMQSGRPFGEAAMRLQEVGVLSGDVRAQLEQMQQAGASGAEMWDIFTKATMRFEGGMSNLSSTFSGKFSNLQDAISIAMAQIGEDLLTPVKDALDFVIKKISEVDFSKLSEQLYEARDAVIIFSAALLGTMIPAIRNAAIAFGSMMTHLWPYMAVAALVAAAAIALAKHFDVSFADIVEFGKRLWENLKQSMSGVIEAVKNAWEYFQNVAMPKIANFFDGVINVVKFFMPLFEEIFGTIWDVVKEVLGAVWDVIKYVFAQILDVLDVFGNAFQGNWAAAWDGVKRILARAWNGLIDIVERGVQLLLIPLNRMIQGMQKVGIDVQTIEADFSSLQLQIEQVGVAGAGYTDAFMRAGDVTEQAKEAMEETTEAVPALGDAFSSAAGTAKDASDDMQEAFDKVKNSAADLSEKLNDSLSEVSESIASIQQSMTELTVEKIEDTREEWEKVAEAFVDTEETIAGLKEEIAETQAEFDKLSPLTSDEREEQNKLAEELALLQDTLAKEERAMMENAHVQEFLENEIAGIKDERAQTDLERAVGVFQEQVGLIEEQYQTEFGKLQEKLDKELDVQNKLLALKAQASEITRKFVLQEEAVTLESINRQIEAYNQLAQAVQNARSGVTTSGVDLSATIAALEGTSVEIPALAEGGIVTRPTLALVGEAGKEAVVPLDRGGWFGMTNNIVINWTGAVTEEAAEMVSDLVARKIEKKFSLL